jgi:hypothetical protein
VYGEESPDWVGKLIELIPTAGFEKADAIAPPFLVRPLRV